MVAIRDASKLQQFKEAIKDVQPQPEILVGEEGTIEVARHPEINAVVTGIVGASASALSSPVQEEEVVGSLDLLLEDGALPPKVGMALFIF